MKRFLWAGAAVLVAAVVAVPLWLALDGDDARRTAALATPVAGSADLGKLTLVGQQSGTVTAQVRSFDFQIRSPRDVATGQATGKSVNGQLQIIKAIDATTPTLMKMVTTNEAITSAKLELIGGSASGKPSVYMTYDFTDLGLASWKDGTTETIALTYQTASAKAGKGTSSGTAAIGQMTYAGTVVPITDFSTGIKSPRDAASGLATGKRQHEPAMVEHALDAFAPTVLANVSGNGGAPATVNVELQRQDASGKTETYATYTYTKATTSSVNDSGAAGLGAAQKLEFTYTGVDVAVGGVVASDSVIANP